MREATRISRFGSVVPIAGSDFIREVSQASPDVWVVVLLYKDGYVHTRIQLRPELDLFRQDKLFHRGELS